MITVVAQPIGDFKRDRFNVLTGLMYLSLFGFSLFGFYCNGGDVNLFIAQRAHGACAFACSDYLLARM